MDYGWLEYFKKFFTYNVPIGVVLIAVFTILLLYMLSTAHIRKSQKLFIDGHSKLNEHLRKVNEDLRKDNEELRRENKELRKL